MIKYISNLLCKSTFISRLYFRIVVNVSFPCTGQFPGCLSHEPWQGVLSVGAGQTHLPLPNRASNKGSRILTVYNHREGSY